MALSYQRRRRLAVLVAAVSAVLLGAWMSFGSFPETLSDPSVHPRPDALYVAHRAGRVRFLSPSEIVQVLLVVDPQTLQLRERHWFYGSDMVCVERDGRLVAFFDRGWRTLGAEGPLESLDQDWPVRAAARDPATGALWLFGVRERAILARRLEGTTAGPVETVAPAGGEVDRIAASFSPHDGPVVVWRERQRDGLRAARRGTQGFEALPDYATGDAAQWTLQQVGPRTLVVWFDRRDHSWTTLTLRLRVLCCPGCGLPPPPAEWAFRDRFQPFERRVTGLGAALDGDRIRVVLARATGLQSATVPAGSLAPGPDAALAPIRLEPAWVRYGSMLMPAVLLFFSISLVYLGFVLMRERQRMLAAAFGLPADAAVLYADTLQRMIAFIIDQMILAPVVYLVIDTASLIPDSPDTMITDARILAAMGIGYAANVLYFLAQEAWGGQTLGKRLVGIRVTDVGSDRLSFRRALLRNLLRAVDAYHVLMIVGLGCILFTRRRQRLGDLVAGTVVVQAEPEQPPSATK